MQKMIYAVGLGPGDAELITIKGVNVLKSSDIVVVPQSDKTGRSIAKDIVSKYIPDDKIYMYYFPMNNDKKLLDKKYEELAEKIEKFLNTGKSVCYVTIGDLSVYSTFNYLHEKLRLRGIGVEKISGIPSFVAAANRIDEAIVKKGESFCVVEMGDLKKLESVVSVFDTVIIMKVHKKVNELIEFVKKSEKVEKAYLVERCTLKGEKVVDLKSDSYEGDKSYLSTAIIFSKKRR